MSHDDARSFEPKTAFDAVSRLVRLLSADAANIRVEWDTKAGPGVLPIPAHDAETVSDCSLPTNDTEREIIKVLKGSSVWMKRDAVRKVMGRETASGTFGEAFKRLVLIGLVVRKGSYYTDDLGKEFKEF